MDLRLIASTFVLIFLAELGDKTQLAALAASAGARNTLSVFVGASCALLLSTFVAVAVGGAFARLAEAHRPIIQGVAGCAFILFGVLFILGAMRGRPVISMAPVTPSPLARLALEMACEFEAASASDYDRLARESTSPDERRLFELLRRQEDAHLADLRGLLEVHAGARGSATLPDLAPPLALGDPDAKDALLAALAHERSTEKFYRALAGSAQVRSLRAVFARLADAESEHARRLEEMIGSA